MSNRLSVAERCFSTSLEARSGHQADTRTVRETVNNTKYAICRLCNRHIYKTFNPSDGGHSKWKTLSQ